MIKYVVEPREHHNRIYGYVTRSATITRVRDRKTWNVPPGTYAGIEQLVFDFMARERILPVKYRNGRERYYNTENDYPVYFCAPVTVKREKDL
jgi:hypothetical protein